MPQLLILNSIFDIPNGDLQALLESVELGIYLSKLHDQAKFSHKEGRGRWFAVDYGPVIIFFSYRSTCRNNYDLYRTNCTLLWHIWKHKLNGVRIRYRDFSYSVCSVYDLS